MTDTDANRFCAALEAFDAANAEDPHLETAGDRELPRELLYAQRMSQRLVCFAPDATEIVRLAARAQHIRRWTKPRSDYPMDRAGYKRWRTDCATMHAEVAGDILRRVGYDDEAVDRVGALLRKKKLKVDAEVQLLEDVICLVFLDHYLLGFVDKHAGETDKLVRILRKTWAKMSAQGQAAALDLHLPERERRLVESALGA